MGRGNLRVAVGGVVDQLFFRAHRRSTKRRADQTGSPAASNWAAEQLEQRLLFTWIGAITGATNDAAHNYNNTANWVSGVIDDSFSGVTFSGNTTLYFTADRTTTSAGLNLDYAGSANLTLTSDSSTARTLTLDGNITGDFGGSSNSQTVTIGSTTAPLVIDAGGASRTYSTGSGDQLYTVSPVVDGILSKGSTASGWNQVNFESAGPGGASFDGTSWQVSGESDGHDAATEQGEFAYTAFTGDLTAIVRVVSQNDADGWASNRAAKLVVRDGTGATALETGMEWTPGSSFYAVERGQSGGWPSGI